jgi:TP901 family phage tail tape measure protein
MAIIVPITTTFDSKGLNKAIGEIKKAEGGFNKFAKTTQIVGASMKDTGKTLSRNVTAPLVAFGAIAVKSFADFDSAITKSTSIMSGVTEKTRDDMTKAARDVAKNLGLSHTAAADSFYFLASAGLDAQQSIAALPQVAAFSKAGMFDMATATDLATDAQSALGLTSKDAAKNLAGMTRVTDVFVKAATLANASVEQFSVAITAKAGVALNILGKDIEEGAAALAVFADKGIKGEAAGVLLTRTLEGLVDNSRNNAQAFKAAGVAVFDASGSMRNMADIVRDLERATKGMTVQQKSALISQLGFNKLAKQGILSLLGSSDALEKYETALKGAGGTTKSVADKQMASLTEQVNVLKAELTDLAIEVAPTIIDGFVKPVMNFIRRLVLTFQSLSKETQTSIIKFAMIAAVLGPALIIIGSLIGALGKIALVVKGLAIAVGFLQKQWVGVGVAATGAATATVAATTIMKRALITTGVGALIVGLGFVAAKFYDVAKAANVAADAKNRALRGQESRDVARSRGRNLTPEKSLEQQLQDLNSEMDKLGGGGGGGGKAPKAAKAVKGLSESAKIAQSQIAKLTDELSRNNDILDKAKDAYASFKSGITSVITGIIDFGAAATAETGTFLENLVGQAAKAADFGAKVKKLLAMGLSETAIGQVLAAGADAGSKIADEIIAGGATVVNQINTLVSATQSVADAVGESAAQQFYQAGITSGEALVEGVKAAIAAAGFSITATGTIINQAGIDQVNKAIAKARTKKSKGGKKITAGERSSIEALAASLGVEVPALAAGGIVTKPTLALIGEAGPEAVVPLNRKNTPMGGTYNITVNAGMGTDGAQVGREIVDAIKRYERTSGPVFASA